MFFAYTEFFRSLLAGSIRHDGLSGNADVELWPVAGRRGERCPCRRPTFRGAIRRGKAPPFTSSIWATMSSIASATRATRGRCPVQYTAFRRRSMSGEGREMVTRCFSEWGERRTVWWIPLRGD